MKKFGVNLYECPKCGLISCDAPARKELYDQKYLEHYKGLAHTELGKRIEAYRWGFLRRHLNGHRTLLDYGAGSGAFLGSHHALPDLELSGYDINPYSPFANSPLPKRPEVITFFDVLEHLESPREIIEGFFPKLLVVLTPNVASVPKSFITQWRHYKPGEHLHLFGVRSLAALFQEIGYQMQGVDFLEGAHRNPNRPTDLITVAATRK